MMMMIVVGGDDDNDDAWTLWDDISSTAQAFTTGHANLLGVLSNYFESLWSTDRIQCPKRASLPYSRPLSGSSLLPVSKDFERSLSGCAHMFWPQCFMFGYVLCELTRINYNCVVFRKILYTDTLRWEGSPMDQLLPHPFNLLAYPPPPSHHPTN
jgi:hypothetical protein